jgi:alpha,alpha-trehalose-phosphate synthase [UDP-forming]/trehalose-phosphatase
VDTRIDLESEYWLSLARHQPLGILTDLDGTLLPFAATPDEAFPSDELRQLVHDLGSLPGVTLAIVSGRPCKVLDAFFPAPRTALLVAEHGAWRGGPAGWESMLSVDDKAIDPLAGELLVLQTKFPGVIVERKTWSIALHFRRVPAHDKMGLLVQAEAVIDPWLAAHPDFEDLAGAEVIEIRPRLARKGNAVGWIRGLLGAGCRLLVVGDDVTDEDMFSATSDEDAPVLVGEPPGRMTAARWCLTSPQDVHAFYRWIIALRREALAPPPPARRPSRVETLPETLAAGAFFDLLVLSNRLPELRSAAAVPSRKRNVGGLVSALGPTLTSRRAIWLGWSGRTHAEANGTAVGLDRVDDLSLAWVDFPEEWHRHYYNGLCNSALWPLLHSFPTRLKISHADWHCYERANEAFASVATKLVRPGSTVWAHDYHLLLLGRFLREQGHTGPIGLFQHVPFPGPDIFFLLPWAKEILSAMLAFDLIGFHTQRYVRSFLQCMSEIDGIRIEGNAVVMGDHVTRVGAFPIGIIPEQFQEAGDATPSDEIAGMMRAIGQARLVLGVDRLDYTKGIPERIAAFGALLEQSPGWRKKACLVQVSVPSRGDVPDYAEQRSRIENIVGRVNGEYGEADWVPIRYLYRSYRRDQLSELYRAADVGYVTPLRDGMNLVAKEYVAAQDPERPGVLVLSRFAGAAEELGEALLVNPWDAEGTARDLKRALEMPLEERKRRHARLLEVISRTTAATWAEGFLEALRAATAGA